VLLIRALSMVIELVSLEGQPTTFFSLVFVFDLPVAEMYKCQ